MRYGTNGILTGETEYMPNAKWIWSICRNTEGYYIIFGKIGSRRYLYYTKREAIRKYNAEARALECRS